MLLNLWDRRMMLILIWWLLQSFLLMPSIADDRKTTNELIRSRGFDVDEMEVVVQSYPLKIYRLINPMADKRTLHPIPVVVAHGIGFDMTNMMSSSSNARPRKPKLDERVTLYSLHNGTDDRGLHFYLSNNNYDVWLLESRGVNEQVQRRLPLEGEQQSGSRRRSFWDFSIDEQALIDLPTQIDLVLRRTSSEKVAFIGYSQSTTFMFALLAMKPDYSKKLSCFIAVAPVVYTGHMRGIVWPATWTRMLFSTSSSVDILPNWARKFVNFGLTFVCSVSYIKFSICRMAWAGLSGPDKQALLEKSMTDNVIKSTSLKTFEQYLQNALLKDFRMYDYKDEEKNMEMYGQFVPPRYNISMIEAKNIALFRGTHDYLSTPEDQMMLLSRLRVPLFEDHILVDYSHIDFMVSPTVTRDVNEPILRILDKLTGRKVSRISHSLEEKKEELAGEPQVSMSAEEEERQIGSTLRSSILIGSAQSRMAAEGEQGKWAQPAAAAEQKRSRENTAIHGLGGVMATKR